MNRKYCIYCHTNKINGKKYIGQTCQNLNRRWQNGKRYKYSNNHFYNAIKKYGWDNFEHEVLFTNLTLEQANLLEYEIIKNLDTTNRNIGYNKKEGGLNGIHSDESRKKMSESSKGIKLSEETKKKISEANKGRIIPIEVRQKISKSHKDIKLSDEHRKNISLSKKGKPSSYKGKKMSEESKLKLSNSQKEKYKNGYVSPLLGRYLSKETKEKIRMANIGKKHTEETKKKISEASKRNMAKPEVKEKIIKSLTGRPCSQETRNKISIAQKGRKQHPNTIKSHLKLIECINTGEVMYSFEFADKYNLKTKNIGNSCRLGTTTQGYGFKYVEVA